MRAAGSTIVTARRPAAVKQQSFTASSGAEQLPISRTNALVEVVQVAAVVHS
jgi:hypothetical protein